MVCASHMPCRTCGASGHTARLCVLPARAVVDAPNRAPIAWRKRRAPELPSSSTSPPCSPPPRPGKATQATGWTAAVLEQYRCPICREAPMVPPVVVECAEGHCICHRCWRGYGQAMCVVCRRPRLFSMVRNRALEQAADTFGTVVCKYDNCAAVVKYTELEAHMASCEHCPVPCPAEGCGALLPRTRLAAHLQQAHSARAVPTQVALSAPTAAHVRGLARNSYVVTTNHGSVFFELHLDASGGLRVRPSSLGAQPCAVSVALRSEGAEARALEYRARAAACDVAFNVEALWIHAEALQSFLPKLKLALHVRAGEGVV